MYMYALLTNMHVYTQVYLSHRLDVDEVLIAPSR